MIKYLGIAFLASTMTYLLREYISIISFSAYKDTLSSLLNISSIIFAIIGAWIAIIYPRAIARIFKLNPSNMDTIDADADYLSELVEIVLVSATVLMMVLTIQFSAPILKSIPNINNYAYLKFGAFFLICLLTLSQLYAVFRVILTNYFFLNELRKKNVTDKVDTYEGS